MVTFDIESKGLFQVGWVEGRGVEGPAPRSWQRPLLAANACGLTVHARRPPSRHQTVKVKSKSESNRSDAIFILHLTDDNFSINLPKNVSHRSPVLCSQPVIVGQ